MPGTVSGTGDAAMSLAGFVQPLTQGTDVSMGRADRQQANRADSTAKPGRHGGIRGGDPGGQRMQRRGDIGAKASWSPGSLGVEVPRERVHLAEGGSEEVRERPAPGEFLCVGGAHRRARPGR